MCGTGYWSGHVHAFQAWQVAQRSGREREFCEQHFISAPTMEMVYWMRVQLLRQMRTFSIILHGCENTLHFNSNSKKWTVVKAALCTGTSPNLILVDREHMLLRTQKELTVMFHPLSTLHECPTSPYTSVAASHSAIVETLPSDWLIYEISRSGQFCHARCCTVVSPITVAFFAGAARVPQDCAFEAKMCCGGGVAES